MLFNSTQFPVFFFLFLLGYFLTTGTLRRVWTLGCSIYFYCTAAQEYLWILLLFWFADFLIALRIEQAKSNALKSSWLFLGVGINLCLLIAFKWKHVSSAVLFPPGLSFHTFQSIAYLVEVHSGRYPAEKSSFRYGQFLLFWPQLIAGPIERPQGLLSQLREEVRPQSSRFNEGVALVLLGFIKKCVVADRLSSLSSQMFYHSNSFAGLALGFGLLAMGFEFYADFSGYTDIARGSARLMGFDLTENFRQPIFARSPQDFWKRWHMSLTRWFEDYIYRPCVNRMTTDWERASVVVVVFVLVGLWHAFTINALLWGLYHSVLLLTSRSIPIARLGWASIPLTFVLVTIPLGLLRTPSFSVAGSFYSRLFLPYQPDCFAISFLTFTRVIECSAAMVLVIGIDAVAIKKPRLWSSLSLSQQSLLLCGGLALVYFFGVFENRSFIYYQF
jgi:alginate O-acetyltransferase complex protein AlgI